MRSIYRVSGRASPESGFSAISPVRGQLGSGRRHSWRGQSWRGLSDRHLQWRHPGENGDARFQVAHRPALGWTALGIMATRTLGFVTGAPEAKPKTCVQVASATCWAPTSPESCCQGRPTAHGPRRGQGRQGQPVASVTRRLEVLGASSPRRPGSDHASCHYVSGQPTCLSQIRHSNTYADGWRPDQGGLGWVPAWGTSTGALNPPRGHRGSVGTGGRR